MSAHLFSVRSHTLPASHIRAYPNATSPSVSQETPLYISAKQYIPLSPKPISSAIAGSTYSSSSPPPRLPPISVTILTAPALGISPECYIPLFDALLLQSTQTPNPKYRIRSIWTAAPTHESDSSTLNSESLGDDTNYFDHSRDLLHLINSHRNEFPRPILGLGHSRGALQLVHLSILHPRLLSGLVLIEPLIIAGAPPPPAPHAALHATKRRDIWPSREAAASDLRSAQVYKTWHPAALAAYITYGLQPTPTPLHPTAPAGSVTLTTTKHQEAWAFARANLAPYNSTDANLERLMSPDIDATTAKYTSHRCEAVSTLHDLPFVRPPVLYIFGAKSPFSPRREIERKMSTTGTGVGGSGGREAGKVQNIVVERTGHFVPLEKVEGCAEWIADGWLPGWIERWEREEEVLKGLGAEKSEGGKRMRIGRAWKEMVEKGPLSLRDGVVRDREEKVGREKL